MSSGGGSQTSTTRVQYSPTEQALRDTLMADARSQFSTDWADGIPRNYYGAAPVGPSWATQDSWGRGMSGANDIERNTQEGSSVNTQLGRAINVDSNPQLQQAIMAAQRPLVQQFASAGGPMSTIRSNAASTGNVGGSRQGIAEGLAMQGLQQQMGDISSKMSSDAYYKGLDAANESVKNQGLLSMLAMMPSQAMGAIGQQQEGYQANQNAFNANVRRSRDLGPYDFLNNMASIANGNTSAAQSTTSSIPRQDNTGQIVGGLGALGLMAMMM